MKKHFRKSIVITVFLLMSQFIMAQVNYEYFLAVGRHSLFEGKYTDAISFLNTAIRVKPGLHEAYLFRGIAKYNLGDYPGAAEDFGKSLAIHPLYVHAFHYRAIAYNRMGDYKNALFNYNQAVEIDPINADIYINRGVTKMQLHDYEGALKDYNLSLQLEPDNYTAYMNRCVIKGIIKDYENAILDCSQAIKLNHFFFDAFLRRGMIRYEMEDYDQAIEDYNYALRIDKDDPIVYFNRALASLKKTDTLAALNDYGTVLKLDPYNALTYYNRAILYSNMERFNQALSDYASVLRINPDNIYALYNRGCVLFEEKRYYEAAADFTKAIDLFPDFANALMNRSSCKAQMNDRLGANEDYLKAMKIMEAQGSNPDSAYLAVADSAHLRRIIEFESDFQNANLVDGRIQYQRIYIDLKPNYKITYYLNDSAYINRKRNEYWNESFVDFNKTNALKRSFGITNEDMHYSVDQVINGINRFSDLPENTANTAEAAFFEGILNGIIQNYNTALNAYDTAIYRDSSFAFAWFNRANIRYELQEFIIEQERQDRVSIGTPFAKKDDERKEMDYAHILNDYNQVIRLLPDFAPAYYNKGNIMARKSDYEAAIDNYTKAIGIENRFGDAYFNRGLARIFMGQNEKGCADLSKSGELGVSDAYNVIKRHCVHK